MSDGVEKRLRNCICGNAVRMGAYRVTVNGRSGVCHYIACGRKHLDSESMLKPYPKHGASNELLRARWNAKRIVAQGDLGIQEQQK